MSHGSGFVDCGGLRPGERLSRPAASQTGGGDLEGEIEEVTRRVEGGSHSRIPRGERPADNHPYIPPARHSNR